MMYGCLNITVVIYIRHRCLSFNSWMYKIDNWLFLSLMMDLIFFLFLLAHDFFSCVINVNTHLLLICHIYYGKLYNVTLDKCLISE